MSRRKHHNHPHPNHSNGIDAQPTEREQSEHDQIERIAYHYWQQRGCPFGEPDEDWYKAEHEFERQREAATRL